MENDSGNKINSEPKKQEKAMGYAARLMGYGPVYTDCINRKQQFAYYLKEVDMTEFKCDTRSHGNFLYGKKQSVFTVLYRLYNYCWALLETGGHQ